MKSIRKYIGITIALGVLSFFAVVASHLALTDIISGETDSSMEWTVLRVSTLVILLFIGLTLTILIRVLRLSRELKESADE